MKGLIRTTILMALLIVVGSGISAIVYNDLANRLAAAQKHGFEEGHAQGYVEGFQDGSRAGYQEGSKTGYLKGKQGEQDSSYGAGFHFVYNPAYNELREILANLTEVEKATAKELHDYAETNGVRAAYVRCPIARQAPEGMVYIYELVAFETVDKGLIIIEPWSHREIKVEVGRSYSELNGSPVRGYDDTITKVTIVW